MGCAMWQHASWPGSQVAESSPRGHALQSYASSFTAVEGNTTFYALPNAATAQRWADSVPADFRFVFKVQRAITHEKRFRSVEEDLAEFLGAVDPLRANLGPVLLQLPASFGPEQLDLLFSFIDEASSGIEWAVEVRHQGFYGSADERRLNDELFARGANRVMLDSRALFDGPAQTAGEIEAFRAKPRVPVRAVATAETPVVRFIGQTNLDSNEPYLQPWVETTVRWLVQGKNPIVFLHTPDNAEAPELVRRFYDSVALALDREYGVVLAPLPPRPDPVSPTLFGEAGT